MRISLGSGAITADSTHTFWMILFIQSFYFLALGLCLIMYDQQLQQNKEIAQPVTASSASTASVLSLDFLFTGGTFIDHPHSAVVLVFLLHGLLLGVVIGNLVERRSWCLDVVLTSETIFFVTTLFIAGISTGIGWRILCLAIDTIGAFFVAFWVAGKREQQEVSFGNDNNNTSAVVPRQVTPTTTGRQQVREV